MIKKLHNSLLSKFNLVRRVDYNAGINSISGSITLDKMELERKYELTIREKDKQINQLKDEVVELKNIKYDFKALIRSFTPAQINALYYEMISYVRNTAEMRHYFSIWFKRMINAIQTIDSNLMDQIEQENGYKDIRHEVVDKGLIIDWNK